MPSAKIVLDAQLLQMPPLHLEDPHPPLLSFGSITSASPQTELDVFLVSDEQANKPKHTHANRTFFTMHPLDA